MTPKVKEQIRPVLEQAEKEEGIIESLSPKVIAVCLLAQDYGLLRDNLAHGGKVQYRLTIAGHQQLEDWKHPLRAWRRKNGWQALTAFLLVITALAATTSAIMAVIGD